MEIPNEVTALPVEPEALEPSGSMIPSNREVNAMMRIANTVAGARVFGLTAELAFCKILAGRELGLPPMASIHEIECYDGKLALGAKGKVAVVRSRALGSIDVVESTAQHAVVEFRRADWPASTPVRRVTFTIEEATAAELTKKNNWRKYARSMLAHRATDMVCNLHFQDVFAGVPYSPDQLGAETDEEGHIVEPANAPWSKPAGGLPVVATLASPPTVVGTAVPPSPAVVVEASPAVGEAAIVEAEAMLKVLSEAAAAPTAYVPRWRAVDVTDIHKLTSVPASKIADALAKAGCKHVSDLPPERIDEIAEKLLPLVNDKAAQQRFRNEANARASKASAPF